jgi:hypothetical protein
LASLKTYFPEGAITAFSLAESRRVMDTCSDGERRLTPPAGIR